MSNWLLWFYYFFSLFFTPLFLHRYSFVISLSFSLSLVVLSPIYLSYCLLVFSSESAFPPPGADLFPSLLPINVSISFRCPGRPPSPETHLLSV